MKGIKAKDAKGQALVVKASKVESDEMQNIARDVIRHTFIQANEIKRRKKKLVPVKKLSMLCE